MKDALLWSSGLESTLLLALLKDKVDIIQFRELWTREQRKKADDLIIKMNLKVFILPPRQVFFASKDSLIFDYGIPLIRDVLSGRECIATLSTIKTAQNAPMTWETYIIGSRKDDFHPLLNQVVPSERFELNGMKFHAPLFNWTREMVKQGLRDCGLDDTDATETEDTGNISLCTKCLDTSKKRVWCPQDKKMIPTVKWNPKVNQRTLRLNRPAF